MLKNGIADPPQPDPFANPLSRYKETRMKSTKDLLTHHQQGKTPIKGSKAQPAINHVESLYTNTTQYLSPARHQCSFVKQGGAGAGTSQQLNPESASPVRKGANASSYVNTPGRSSRGSSNGSRNGDAGAGLDEQFDQDRYNVYHKLKMGYVSPMKGIEEEHFIDKMKEWLKVETYIDGVKEELILYCEDFGPVQAFRIFVQKPDKGRNITISNLVDAFELFNVPLSQDEAHLIMTRIDSNRDGILTYTDICDVFRPRN